MHRQHTPQTADAIGHTHRGWHVFPVLPDVAGCTCDRQRHKKPLIENWPNRAINDPATIERVWPAGHNIGVACEPSGLVVIDLDVGKPLPPPWDTTPGVHDGRDVFALESEQHLQPGWPNTYTVETSSGGVHLYYTANGHDIRNSASRVGPLIDVRANGGYVLAAGSVIHGVPYRVINPVDPLPLPGWLAALATKEPRPTRVTPKPNPPTANVSDRYVRAAFTREVEAVATAWAGGRNNQLNKSAFALARFVAAGQLDGDVVIDTLTAAARHAGLGDHEIRRTLQSALTARGAAA